jgi:serine-type D-Ala-D-Ala carboxypeptidase/endopeptidase (penicillin-binding protein 4)
MSSSRRALVFALVALTASAACAARTGGQTAAATNAPSRAHAPSQTLANALNTLFTSEPANHVMWGVCVRSLRPGQAGELLYQRNSEALLHPASNMKLLTLAAAATRLGWDFRFDTTVRATTAIEHDGTVRGDLVIVGSGDPSIGRRFDGAATMAGWADRIFQQGVRRIEGRVIGDASAFRGTSFGEGWQWDDLPFGYAAPVSALTFNENTAEVTIAPGPSEGARAQVTLVDTAAPNLLIVNRVSTVPSTATRRVSLSRTPEDPRLTWRGEIPLGSQPLRQFVAVDDPPLYFARALRSALVARGIVVVGDARSAVSDPPGPLNSESPVLIRHQSPPLRDLARTLMKISQNLYAEVLLRAVGKAAGASGDGTGALAEVLQSWGAGRGAVVVGDGSGLSRYNLTSAAAIDTVLTRMFTSPSDQEPWLAALPIAGVDGTLERRMKGTVAEGRVHAKTGTIAYVRALSGYARTADDEWVQFTILANNFAGNVTTAEVDRISEQAVNLLAGYSRETR